MQQANASRVGQLNTQRDLLQHQEVCVRPRLDEESQRLELQRGHRVKPSNSRLLQETHLSRGQAIKRPYE